jgi:hypothetical protein
MNSLEKDLKLVNQHINDAEIKLQHRANEQAYGIAFALMQEVKLPMQSILRSNTRGRLVSSTCERLIEFLIRCGNISFTERPTETMKLSALLNYSCYLFEEFNLNEDVADFLSNTYTDWYLPQSGEAV